MGVVVDPENENLAILSNGKLAGSIRIAPVGTPMDEMKDAPIVGWADFDQFRQMREVDDA